MMKETFDISQKAVIVPITIEADGLIHRFFFIVDTGSYETLICEKTIRIIGYTPADSFEDVPVHTVSGSSTAYRYAIDNITALGISRKGLKVISLQMPAGSGAHGLLGLDFFEEKDLYISFRKGTIRVD